MHVASSCRSMCLVKTLDELRVRTWKRTRSVLELEPTSHSIIGGHIKRWLFLYKVCSDLLAMDYIMPNCNLQILVGKILKVNC